MSNNAKHLARRKVWDRLMDKAFLWAVAAQKQDFREADVKRDEFGRALLNALKREYRRGFNDGL